MKDSLGDRMKNNYESVTKTRLVRRMPVAIRVDGKAFHTFTRGFNKPYDTVFSDAMCKTMKSLCGEIQGCVFGYTQSDEITLVLVDYKELDTVAWFDGEVQKMCSVSAALASVWFARHFAESVDRFVFAVDDCAAELLRDYYGVDPDNESELERLVDTYRKAIESVAVFDSRVFNVPKEEVANMLIWRQKDATRNSIEMLGQHHIGHKRMNKVNCSGVQDMLMEEFGINWNDVEARFKRGACCIRKDPDPEKGERHPHWGIDFEPPVFTKDRDYIEKWILFEKRAVAFEILYDRELLETKGERLVIGFSEIPAGTLTKSVDAGTGETVWIQNIGTDGERRLADWQVKYVETTCV